MQVRSKSTILKFVPLIVSGRGTGHRVPGRSATFTTGHRVPGRSVRGSSKKIFCVLQNQSHPCLLPKRSIRLFRTTFAMTSSPLDAAKTAELSRVMIPADANVAGNVHGGTIMQMIEESACVAASRFFNHYSQTEEAGHVRVLTARVESITFQQPLHVGDVAKVRAQVVFSSKRTVAVAVKVVATRLTSNTDIIGNRALLWIVGHTADCDGSKHEMAKNKNGIATVQRNARESHVGNLVEAPQLDPPTDMEGKMAYTLAKMAYDNRKANHASDPASLPEMMNDEEGKSSNRVHKDDAFAPDLSAVE